MSKRAGKSRVDEFNAQFLEEFGLWVRIDVETNTKMVQIGRNIDLQVSLSSPAARKVFQTLGFGGDFTAPNLNGGIYMSGVGAVPSGRQGQLAYYHTQKDDRAFFAFYVRTELPSKKNEAEEILRLHAREVLDIVSAVFSQASLVAAEEKDQALAENAHA